MEFKNLRELITKLPDEQSCRAYLAKQRWPDGKVICPHCGHDKCYIIDKGAKYKCAKKECHKKFSIKVGTIFEASNIPLTHWFIAMYLATANKKGISSYQLAKHIGVSQKCAWFMLHRIREMMRPKEPVKLDNIVEIDEVYIGGSISNMHKKKRKEIRENGTLKDTKSMVMGLIERGGDLKLIPGDHNNEVLSIHPIIYDNVDKDAVLLTDTSGVYIGLKDDYAGHETVNHSNNEYVRDGVIHTNTIEGAFSHLKRCIIGTYHKVTVKHLSRYCEETAFRYNFRKIKDPQRFDIALQKITGRLTYKELISAPQPKIELTILIPEITVEKKAQNKPVLQIRNREVVNQYPSIKEAAKAVGVDQAKISMVLRGKRKRAAGFEWKYVDLNHEKEGKKEET